jgi:sec-independent protein translocase protein TatB
VFSNLDWTNVMVLLLLALFIFGNKLPQMLVDGLRMLRNLRRMAQNATADISRELGTDIRLEDLHPKTFVRKHLLTELEQEALTRPLKQVSEDLLQQARGVDDEVRTTATRAGHAVEDGAGAAGATTTTPTTGERPPALPAYDDIT